MKCSVIKNSKNEIERVLAPNGKESKLFNDVNSLVEDKEEALKLWAQVYTPRFKEWFGDWELLNEAISNIDNVKGMYKDAFKEDPQQALFEASVQSHSSKSEHE